MATQAIPGFEAQLYIGGVKLLELGDVTLTIAADELDVSSHTSGGWKSKLGGLKEWSLSADYWFIDADATHQALRNALVNGTPLTCELRTKDTTGKEKYTGTGRVIKWELGAPQNDATGTSIEISGDGPLTFGTV